MKHYHIIKKPLILTMIMVVSLFCFSSCSLYTIYTMDSYEEFSEISNTIWSNLYFKLKNVKIPNYDLIVYKDTCWRKKDSPIVIDGNMFILPGVSISIDPGVTVMIGKNVLVSCRGIIVARGTETEPILFTWQKEGEPWNAIECNNCMKKAGRTKANHLVFENCIIEHGQGLIINSSEAAVSSCEFRHNTASALKFEYAAGVISGNRIYENSTKPQSETGNGGGINVYTDKTVLIENNEIYDNVSHGGRDGGGGIYAFAYNEGTVKVINNTVRNNISDRKAGGIFAYDAEVTGNTIINNRSDKYGGGLYAIQSIVKDNIIAGNKSAEGGGVYSEDGDMIRYNSFTENYGVCPEGCAAIALSGNPVLEENNIIAPAGYALRFLSHSLSPDLKAHKNYWGTTDEAIIEALIFDWLEDGDVGLVSWKNYRPSAITRAYPVANEVSLKTKKTVEKSGPDTIRGSIEVDTVLGDAGIKRYTVPGNLLVQEGTCLDIAPGTELFLKQDATIRVRGQLTAGGEPNQPIKLTGDRKQPWGRLLFENRSLTEAGQAAAAQTKSILSHCIIENGSGLLMDGYGADMLHCTVKNHKESGLRIKEVPATIKNCLIHDNVSDSDGGGIYVYGSKRVFIHGNRITGNTAADGGGVFAYGYRSNVAVDIRDNIISGNTSMGDGGGLWVSRSAVVNNTVSNNQTEEKGGGVFAGFALINGNRIHENTAEQGGGVFAEANSSFIDNTIAGNTCRGKMGGGVFLNYWGLSLHNKIFFGNIIENNIAAATGAGGVIMNGKMSFGGNVIARNSGIQLYNQSPAGPENIIARDCYWGLTDKDQIDDYIYDGADDPSLAVVDYKPFARTRAEALQAPKPPGSQQTTEEEM